MSAEKLRTCTLNLFFNFSKITSKNVLTFREERVKVVSNLHVKLTDRFVFSIPNFPWFQFLKRDLHYSYFIVVDLWKLSTTTVKSCQMISFGAILIISSTEIRLVIIVTLSIEITWNKKLIKFGGAHVYMCTIDSSF